MGDGKMLRKKLYHLLLLLVCLSQFSLGADSWRVLFYMDSTDDLSDMAFKSITEMMQAELGDTVECFIQLHAFHDIAYRYKVENRGLHILEQIKLTGSSRQDFIDAAAWAFDNNNADHTMLILSNHGWGILDPRWSESQHKWVVDSDEATTCCTLKRSYLNHIENHRGFMFNDVSQHTYLTNNDLIAGLDYITTRVLDSTIDIIAFDTCMGAMIEVAYQLAPFANFMVGCQSCALKDGFEYRGTMEALKNESSNSPGDVAIGMVEAFDAYYNVHDDKAIYTNSAFDLRYVWDVGDAMNNVIRSIMNIPNALEILQQARKDTPRLCMWPMYTDMIEFFVVCGKYIEDNAEFDEALTYLRDVHSQMIVAYCGGLDVYNVIHGSAIYCPFSRIDRSYYTTVFAQSSEWINVLQYMSDSGELCSGMQEWTVGGF